MLPEAVSPIGNTFTYALSPVVGKGLSFDPKTRKISGVPNAVIAATDYTYTATDSEGQTVTFTRSIEVVAGVREPQHVVDGEGAAFFADGAGTVVHWYGH